MRALQLVVRKDFFEVDTMAWKKVDSWDSYLVERKDDWTADH